MNSLLSTYNELINNKELDCAEPISDNAIALWGSKEWLGSYYEIKINKSNSKLLIL